MTLKQLTLSILLLAVITKQSQAVSCSLEPNYFFNWLNEKNCSKVVRTSSVEVKTKTDDTICFDSWSQIGGSCCNDKELLDFNQKMIQNSENEIRNFNESGLEMKDLKTKFSSLGLGSEEILLKYLSQFSSSELIGLTPREGLESLNYIQNFQKEMENRKDDFKKCNYSLMDVRGKAYCNLCAARGYQFIDWQTRPLIKDGTCNDLLRDCGQTWLFMTKVKMAAYLFQKIFAKKTNNKIMDDCTKFVREKYFFSDHEAANVIRSLDKCKDGNCNKGRLNLVCESFLNILYPLRISGQIHNPLEELDEDCLKNKTTENPSNSTNNTTTPTTSKPTNDSCESPFIIPEPASRWTGSAFIDTEEDKGMDISYNSNEGLNPIPRASQLFKLLSVFAAFLLLGLLV